MVSLWKERDIKVTSKNVAKDVVNYVFGHRSGYVTRLGDSIIHSPFVNNLIDRVKIYKMRCDKQRQELLTIMEAQMLYKEQMKKGQKMMWLGLGSNTCIGFDTFGMAKLVTT